MGIPRGFGGLDAQMINLIKHKAWGLVGTIGFTISDRDDIEQELALHLIKCLPRFDSERGRPMTFVARVLDNKIATMVEARMTQYYDFRMHSFSLNELCQDVQEFTDERGEEMDEDGYLIRSGHQSRPSLEMLEMCVDLERVVSRLPRRLRELCRHLQIGNVTEVSRATGVPRGRVYLDIARLKTIFEDAGLGEYL
ncbi:MAG: RNA polymerase subunit sigma-24 [Armatimonadetes bacterium]|nr:RNA polymerase subunit sigma-24 [Armatimonadota bacterium]